MSTKLSEVVTINKVSLADIPGKLRETAGHIEEQSHGWEGTEIMIYVTRDDDHEVTVGAFGPMPDIDEIIGILQRAVHKMSSFTSAARKG